MADHLPDTLPAPSPDDCAICLILRESAICLILRESESTASIAAIETYESGFIRGYVFAVLVSGVPLCDRHNAALEVESQALLSAVKE
jgi:hypothetical protein